MNSNVLQVSQFDYRKFEAFSLPNGLDVLVCEDAKAQVGTACMSVRIGALADPYSGIAHLLEHMLFVQSKKYGPKEYHNFIAKNSGGTNASTSSERTTFYFYIPVGFFEQALDIFAQFFVAPAFDRAAVEREISAVNSEHVKNLTSDSWRMQQMNRSLAGESPYRHFSTGSEKTLLHDLRAAGVDVCSVLEQFHSDYYVPSRMKLVIIAPRPVAVLRTLVEELFAPMESKSGKEFLSPSVIYPNPKVDCGRFIELRPVADMHMLRVLWGIPERQEDYQYGALAYVSFILADEGPGSLAFQLKEKQWATGVAAGSYERCMNFSLFGTDVYLTELGLKHIPEAIEFVFSYIGLIREVGPQEWLFKEIGLMSKTDFLFAQRENPEDEAQNIAEAMANFRKPAHYLHRDRVMEIYDPDRIRGVISLLVPELSNITLVSSSLPESSVPLVEPHYGCRYNVSRIEASLLARCSDRVKGVIAPPPELKLPHPNRFIATDFSLLPSPPQDGSKNPESLVQDRFCQVWYQQDDEFKLPHSSVTILVRSLLACASPETSAFTQLLVRIIFEATYPMSFEAGSASLHFAVVQTDVGLRLSFWGLSHKLPKLMSHVLEVLEHSCAKLPFDRFSSLREEVLRDLQNYHISTPTFLRTNFYGAVVSEVPRFEPQDKAEALKHLTLEQFKAFVKEFFHSVFFNALISGNISREKAWSLTDRIRTALFDSSVVPMSQCVLWQTRRSVKFELGRTVFDNRLGAPKDCSSGLLYRFQVPDTMRNYALALLFEAFFEPSVRGELRADKELGYAVLSFMRREWNAVYWNILIQTDRRMSLAETFVANFMASTIPRELELLKDENVFAQLCNGCISNLRQPYQSLQEQCEAQFKEIESLKPDFDFRRRVADLIESKALSSADLIEFARSYILPMASKRRLLLVRTHAQPDSKPQSALAIRELSEPELVPTVQDVHETVIESLGAWKRSRPLNGSNSKL